MAILIGPTFPLELAAAGCTTDLFWAADGTIVYGASVTADQSAAVQKVVAAHDPTKQLPRSASAKQVRYALNDLGVRGAWNTAVMASDQPSQDYWTSCDPMYEANSKIVRWCKAAGITSKALFDQAVTE